MEYISHEDYKSMMGKFQAETPKGILKEALDPVGKEDSDIDNDGDTDKTDKYLLKRRKAIGKAMHKEEWDSPYDGGADDLAAMASDSDREVAFAEKAIEKILGEPVKFVGQDKNDLATYVGSDPRVKYSIDDLGFIYKDNGFTRAKIGRPGSYKRIGESLPSKDDISKDVNGTDYFIGDKVSYQGHSFTIMIGAGGTVVLKHSSGRIIPHDLSMDILRQAAVDKKFGSVDEYQFDQMYPDDRGPFEGKNFMDPDESYFTMAVADELDGGDWGLSPEQLEAAQEYLEANYYHLQGDFANNHEVGGGSGRAAKYIVDLIKKQSQDMDSTIKEFLMKEDDVNWDRVDDEEAEENETDNGIEEGKDMEEGLNSAPFQATGPTIQTVEAKHDVTKLKAEERDQLKQYIETIRTVKEEISKMLNKTKMKEGGDNTNLIMKPSTVSEDEMGQGGDKHEAIEKALGAKHQVIHNAIDKIIQTVKESGFSEGDAALFLQHEIEEKAKEYAMGQYD